MIMKKFVEFIIRFRWLVLLSLFTITGMAAWEARRNLVFDFSPTALFMFDDPDREYFDTFKEVFGEGDSLMILMFSREKNEIFTIPFLNELKKLTEHISEIDHVGRCISLVNAPHTVAGKDSFEIRDFLGALPTTAEELASCREQATTNRIYRNQFVSADGKTLAIIIEFEHGFTSVKGRRPVLKKIRSVVEKRMAAAEAAEPAAGPVRWHIAGVPVVQSEYSNIMRVDMTNFVIITIVIIAFLLFVVFRNAHGIYIPLGAVGMATIWTIGLLVFFGEKINAINNCIPTLLLVIGVADSIHILARYYEEIGIAPDQKRLALINSIKHVGIACFLTSITTGIGFGSLYAAKITTIKHFGIFACIGVMFAYLINMTWMPAALSLHRPPRSGIKESLDQGVSGHFMAFCGRTAINNKLLICLISAVILVVSVLGGYRLQVESRMMEELPRSNPVWIANNFAETHLTGVLAVDFCIDGPAGSMKDPAVLKSVEKLQTLIEDSADFVTKSMSFVDMLKEMNQAFHDGDPAYYAVPESRELVAQYLLLYESSGNIEDLERFINYDHSRIRISCLTTDCGTARFFRFKKEIKEKIKDLFPPVITNVKLTGSSVIAKTAINNLISDMLSSILTAFILILIMMGVLFRSLKIGLISMVPTVLPLLVTIGFMGFSDIHLRTSTVLIFSVSIGIAIDNTIHFISRFRYEAVKDWDYPAAILRTTISTGRAIVFTSMILILGFSVMGTSDFIALKDLALLGSITLLMALFASIFILPVCLLIFQPIKPPKR